MWGLNGVCVTFLSTPSARRATFGGCLQDDRHHISIHALREEGDVCSSLTSRRSTTISIHALREEGDLRAEQIWEEVPKISIHALREEGDALENNDKE